MTTPLRDYGIIPAGLCQCGCGQKTKISDRNHRIHGYVKNQPRFFLPGHQFGFKLHGRIHTPVWNSWCAMKYRTCNPNCKSWKDYGGRGIGIDPRWGDFLTFLSDMGERPGGTTLERIDNSKGYSKENCCWAPSIQQANNRRGNRRITIKGKTQTISQWAREIGIAKNSFASRLRYGWDESRLLSPRRSYTRPTPSPSAPSRPSRGSQP